jgi:hypothetical protein
MKNSRKYYWHILKDLTPFRFEHREGRVYGYGMEQEIIRHDDNIYKTKKDVLSAIERIKRSITIFSVRCNN